MEPEVLMAWAGEIGSPVIAWLLLAFALGLVHAFDADHVAALSVFATRKRGTLEGLWAGLRWAIGHGLVLILAGLLLFGLGRAMPLEISILAERAVGGVMIGLGLFVFFDLARQRSHLHFHAHDGLPAHAHWHTHEASAGGHRKAEEHAAARVPAHHHEHGALMVGALHGLAGSAPILAVLPAAARSPGLGLAYLVLFALGVAVAMGAVSGLLGHLAGRLSQPGPAQPGHTQLGRAPAAGALAARARGLATLRVLSASGSIGLGAWIAWSS